MLFVDDGSQKVENTWCLFRYIPVKPSDAIVISYPYRIDTNLNFDSDKLKKYIKEITNSSDSVILDLNLCGEVLGLTTLTSFAKMFGD